MATLRIANGGVSSPTYEISSSNVANAQFDRAVEVVAQALADLYRSPVQISGMTGNWVSPREPAA